MVVILTTYKSWEPILQAVRNSLKQNAPETLGVGWFKYVYLFKARVVLGGSGYLGYVDSNQGKNNLYKWVCYVPKS